MYIIEIFVKRDVTMLKSHVITSIVKYCHFVDFSRTSSYRIKITFSSETEAKQEAILFFFGSYRR